MQIKTKISVLIAFMSVFLIAIGVIGLAGFRESNRALEHVYAVNMKNSGLLSTINGHLRANRIQLLLSLQHDPKNEFSALHEHPTSMHTDLAKKYSGDTDAVWKEYAATVTTSEGKKLADDFAAKRKLYEDALTAAGKAVLNDDFQEAYRITFDGINPAVQAANKSLEALTNYEVALAKQSHDAAVKRASLFRLIIISALALAVVTGVAVGLFIARAISRSVVQLKETAAALAAGDLARRSHVQSHDELAEISGCFNQVADTLSAVVSQVSSSARQVSDTARELQANAEQIATGSDHVAAEAATVATAGEEMAATSNDIASNCTMAVESANQASQTANDGSAVIQKTVAGMARIAARVQDSARTVETLGEKSEQIGAIISTIEDIADQTNLLALNAAIEAARAGEQGRGFAVVADEVRALAERTTRATREIGDMIKSIQVETRNAVSAMGEGVAEVEKGTVDAAHSGEALNEILSRVNDVTGQIHQIATAAEEQTATTNEISNNLQRITDVVQETVGSSRQTASAAARLSELAADLQRVVDRFRM